MKKIQAKKFQSRSELEKEIGSTIGLTADRKSDYIISGTRDELRRLHLSGNTMFWGITCIETDPEVKKKLTERPDRGKRTPFGINKRDEKTKKVMKKKHE